jgi:hypothetical protein
VHIVQHVKHGSPDMCVVGESELVADDLHTILADILPHADNDLFVLHCRLHGLLDSSIRVELPAPAKLHGTNDRSDNTVVFDVRGRGRAVLDK